MRTLVGLEPLGEGEPPILTLLNRLDFPEERRTLASVVGPVASEGWQLAPLLGDVEAERRERVAVSRAERRLELIDPGAKHRVAVGHPAQELLAEAEKLGVDLVGTNATSRSGLEALFTGSVARSLVMGAAQSVLLARPSAKTGPLDRKAHV